VYQAACGVKYPVLISVKELGWRVEGLSLSYHPIIGNGVQGHFFGYILVFWEGMTGLEIMYPADPAPDTRQRPLQDRSRKGSIFFITIYRG
jgi:hypothetical protein